MKKAWALLVISFFMTHLQESQGSLFPIQKTRNGGEAVVCYQSKAKNKIVSIELLDHKEWFNKSNYGQLDLGNESLSVPEKIAIVLDRVEFFEPQKAQALRLMANRFSSDIEFYLSDRKFRFSQNPDKAKIKIKAPCFKEPFGIHYLSKDSKGHTFKISKKLYNHRLTSNNTRAGIILHEIFYRFAREKNQHKDSNATREYNFLMSSTIAESMSDRMYANVVDEKLDLSFRYGCRPIKSPLYRLVIRSDGSGGKCKQPRNKLHRVSFPFLYFEAYSDQILISKNRIGILKAEKFELNLKQGNFSIPDFKFNLDKIKDHWSLQAVSQPLHKAMLFNRIPCSSKLRRDGLLYRLRDEMLLGCQTNIGQEFDFKGDRIKVNEIYYRNENELDLIFLNGPAYLKVYEDFKGLVVDERIAFGKNNYIAHDLKLKKVELPLKGTNRTFTFSGLVGFSGDYPHKVYSGTLTKPFHFTYNGKKLYTRSIQYRRKGLYRVSGLKDFQYAYKGRRVIGGYRGDRFCRKMGFKVKIPKYSSISSRREFIGRTEEFYNISTNRFVTKSDEYVEVFQGEVACYLGMITIPL